jgi:hypothetical protein
MCRGAEKLWRSALLALLVCVASAGPAVGQRTGTAAADDAEFGPVVRTYLGYLRAEQEVVDDRASRREIDQSYFRRNTNRIRALRQMAVRIARETQNDFLPELYAVTRDELGTLFDPEPQATSFRVGEIVNNTFRYLGTVRAVEPFYLFARLDVYEQSELLQKGEAQQQDAQPQNAQPQPAQPAAAPSTAPDAPPTTSANAPPRGKTTAPTRPRRVHTP